MTPVVVSFVVEPLFGRDMSLVERMSRQLNDVATSFSCSCCHDCLMMSRPQVFTIDVATTRCCHDLLSSSGDVATLISLQAAVATASDSVLMSRQLPDVAT